MLRKMNVPLAQLCHYFSLPFLPNFLMNLEDPSPSQDRSGQAHFFT